MKRIALLVEASGGGTGRHVLDLAGGLLDRGHEVHVLFAPARTDLAFRTGVSEIQSHPNGHSHAFPMSRRVSFSDFKVIRNLNRYLAGHGPFDVLHAHSTKAGLIGRIAGKIGGIRTVYTPHAPMTMDPNLSLPVRKGVATLELFLSHFSDSIIAVSQAESTHLAEIGIPKSRISMIPNGIVAASEASGSSRKIAREVLGLAEGQVCLGFVGRLAPQKALDQLLIAFASMHDALPGCRLAVVGDGPLRTELEYLAKALGLNEKIIWCGERIATEVMQGFDVFVLPSLYESLPYVILEAMQSGLPVLATDVGGLPTLVDNGVNGLLVPPRSPYLLAGCIRLLAENRDLRERMGLHSLRKVEQFSLSRMVEQIEGCYGLQCPMVQMDAVSLSTF